MVTNGVLEVYQGDDYQGFIAVTNPDDSPTDLSIYSIKGHIRREPADRGGPIEAELIITIDGHLIFLHLPHAVTAKMTGRYLWDLQLTTIADGMITTIMGGHVPVQQQITI
jgi:hypothetical protein